MRFLCGLPPQSRELAHKLGGGVDFRPYVEEREDAHGEDEEQEDVAAPGELEGPVYSPHGLLQVQPSLCHRVFQAVQDLRVQPALVLNVQRELLSEGGDRGGEGQRGRGGWRGVRLGLPLAGDACEEKFLKY